MEKLHIIANIDEDGDLICFCPYEDYLKGDCICRDKADCPEAMINITILPNSRPSQQGVQKVTSEVKKVEKQVRHVIKSTNKIKEGLNSLDQAMRKNKFRL